MLCTRKQNSLWAEGDVFQEKMLNERENGKMAVTRILSGVDDISINGSNKNRALKKEDMDLVSLDVTLSLMLLLVLTQTPLCTMHLFCFTVQ